MYGVVIIYFALCSLVLLDFRCERYADATNIMKRGKSYRDSRT